MNVRMRDTLIWAGIMAAAVGLSMALSGIYDDNNPFATPLFILAVALIARLTEGYRYGIAASLAGTFCVNYMFTYPFWEFDVTPTGYPLTFSMLLMVSLIISALTTQIKRQEQLRFAAQKDRAVATLEPAYMIRADLMDKQEALIDMLYDDQSATDDMKRLKADIDRQKERLEKHTLVKLPRPKL